MQKPTNKLIPLFTKGVMPGAVLASGLISPVAHGASGDLDSQFGDLGRLGPILNGPAWSVKERDDGSILLAGGNLQDCDDTYCCSSYYSCYYSYYSSYYEGFSATNFVNVLSDTGSFDPIFNAAMVADTQVLDLALQPDGQLVGVGRRVSIISPTSQLIVFRLQTDGPMDTTFGNEGIFALPFADYGDRQTGNSVVLDPDGQIIVAGSRDDQLIVLRLLPDGSFDDSFGTSGVFTGTDTYDFSDDHSGARTNILRTDAGGYRVTVSNLAGCQVVALTAEGALDNTFGNSGVSTVSSPSGPSTSCSSMVTQPDGRLLVAGSAVGQGFASRLLESGQADPGFFANAVSNAMTGATALALGEDGSVVVAGGGVSGAAIMRLHANGQLDTQFGNAGSTLIDLASDVGTSPVIRDMIVRPDGGVLAAGGDDYSNQAFVVRLLGAGGGDSPGVLGTIQQRVIQTAEGDAEIVVAVRRTGGDSGSVSVTYQTIPGESRPATVGEDYIQVAGRLTWEDGDVSDQEVHVPILADSLVEETEFFSVLLGDLQSGAGLGTRKATVEIAADGGPYGQFAIERTTYAVPEHVPVTVTVLRNYYSTGAVSVTLSPIGGTATTGEDFVADPVTLFWADGDSTPRLVEIAIIDDALEEGGESFTVELSDPTGGAVIGPQSRAAVLIAASDQPPPPAPPVYKRGGGTMGFLSLLLLGVIRALRPKARPDAG